MKRAVIAATIIGVILLAAGISTGRTYSSFREQLIRILTTSGTATQKSCLDEWIFLTTTSTRTLCPADWSTGQTICFFSTTGATITIDPAGTEKIFLHGTLLGAGVAISNTAGSGDYICFLSNGTNWYSLGERGTWDI